MLNWLLGEGLDLAEGSPCSCRRRILSSAPPALVLLCPAGPSLWVHNPPSTGCQVRGEDIKHMAPGQRAEALALRNAFGADYEARLRQEAGEDDSCARAGGMCRARV